MGIQDENSTQEQKKRGPNLTQFVLTKVSPLVLGPANLLNFITWFHERCCAEGWFPWDLSLWWWNSFAPRLWNSCSVVVGQQHGLQALIDMHAVVVGQQHGLQALIDMHAVVVGQQHGCNLWLTCCCWFCFGGVAEWQMCKASFIKAYYWGMQLIYLKNFEHMEESAVARRS